MGPLTRLQHRVAALLMGVCLVMASGCTALGPRSIQTTRVDYNVAIQQTNEQELLLNLVRLKYRDSLYFLGVEKVASSVELLREMGASASLPEGGANTYTLGAGRIAVNEKPTVFYAPLDGERFTRQILTLLHPDILVLQANSGWSLERLMSLMFQEMNGLKNAPSATGPTPGYEPVYAEFRQAVRHLRSLQVRKLIDVGQISDTGSAHLELPFLPDATQDPEALAFKTLLGLSATEHSFKVVVGLGHGGPHAIHVVPRSLIGIMNYLSQGVVPPAGDVAAGKVTRRTRADGSEFDWQAVMGGLFRVEVTDTAPPDAAISVRHRGHWFSIPDNDLESRSTFGLLSQLMALQAGTARREPTPISFPFPAETQSGHCCLRTRGSSVDSPKPDGRKSVFSQAETTG
jgi:hypothetical protein